MKATGSISRGKTAERHNTRECYRDEAHTPGNIDRTRTPENVVLVNRTLEDVYRERFGEACEAYNAQQVAKRHPERQISDYLEKVRADKKLQPMYEFVVQVGNRDEHPDAGTAAEIYSEWLDGFQERFGEQFAVKQAIVHMDEAVPHMHVEVVPCATSARGLAVQNSMNKAVKQAGFADYKAMLAGWDEVLTECMARHGVERVAGDREQQMGGVDIETYKRSKAVEREAEEAERRLERLQRRESELGGEIEGLKEQVRAAELEPPVQNFAESARTLLKARGDGEREEELRGELEGLRERLRASEGTRDGLGERVRGLEAEAAELGGRVEQLGERVERARGESDARAAGIEQRVDEYRVRVESARGRLEGLGELIEAARGRLVAAAEALAKTVGRGRFLRGVSKASVELMERMGLLTARSSSPVTGQTLDEGWRPSPDELIDLVMGRERDWGATPGKRDIHGRPIPVKEMDPERPSPYELIKMANEASQAQQAGSVRRPRGRGR